MDVRAIGLQATEVTSLVVLIVSSFLPPIIFAVWIRNTERRGREPWGEIASMFVWGAVFAVIIGALLSLLFLFLFQAVPPVGEFLARRFQDPATILLALVIAPFTEEFAKGWGVRRRRRVIREPEDGLVYGATGGFGFSATENLLYGVAAFVTEGLTASILVIAVRSVSSSLLHASATSLTGYGIARNFLWGPKYSFVPWYFGAVAMHATFNGLASLGVSVGDVYGDIGVVLVLAGAVLFSLLTIGLVRSRIIHHEGREGLTP